jgi:nucleoid-associated protein YgaU
MSPEKVAILVVAGLIAVLLAVALLGTESNGNAPAAPPTAAKAAAEKSRPAPKQIEEYTYTDIVRGQARFRPEPKPPVEAQPADAKSSTTEYTIRSGDTIDKIARRELGRRELAGKILALNKGINPSRLKIGSKIVIPVVDKKPDGMLAGKKKVVSPARKKTGPVVAKAVSKTP